MEMKKILVIGITALLTGLILTKSIGAVVMTSKPRVNKQSLETSILGVKVYKKIFDEIKATTDKTLVVDKIIGANSSRCQMIGLSEKKFKINALLAMK